MLDAETVLVFNREFFPELLPDFLFDDYFLIPFFEQSGDFFIFGQFREILVALQFPHGKRDFGPLNGFVGDLLIEFISHSENIFFLY
jgi:hypothetical protein